jgi:cytoskeletal protein CcmA (bactofilin family)
MAEETSPTDPILSIFTSSLLDETGQPNLDISEKHELTWKLVNNATGAGQNLVVTPFGSGVVGPNQYHFVFEFKPGALTDAPTLQGWDVAVKRDPSGSITRVYIALSGNKPLSIEPRGHYKATMTYTQVEQGDANSSIVAIKLISGSQVNLTGYGPIPDKSFGPFNLTLVPPHTAPQSLAPLSVDFVGRRTVINDGSSPNSFTFALTNMTKADLPLTPKVSLADTSPTIFTVWFDAAPNDPPNKGFPWALARVQNLASNDVTLAPTPASPDWRVAQSVTKAKDQPVNPQWEITVTRAIALGHKAPVFFTFEGIITDLDPGFTRMYLSYQNLPGYQDGTLIAELEKSPLIYGATRGQGLVTGASDSIQVGDFNTLKDQYIALKVAGGSKYAAGIKLRAHSDKVGFTIKFNDAKAMLQILRHWNGDPVPALEIKATTGKLTVYDGLEVKGGINGKTLTIGGDALVVSNDKVTMSQPLTVTGRVTGDSLTIGGDALVVSNDKVTMSQPLTVTGRVTGDSLTIGTNALVEGKVGIGTTTPHAILQVGGIPGNETMFGDITTVGIVQRADDSVGLSVRKVDANAVLQFCVYNNPPGDNTPCGYIQLEKGTGDLLIGDFEKNTRFSAAGNVAVNGKLKLTGGVIQHGDGTVPTGDLGLYSTNKTNWLRFVTNQGDIKFFSDGGGGTKPIVTITSDGDLIVKGSIWTKIDGVYKYLGGYGGSWGVVGWHDGTLPSDVRLKRGVQTVHSALDKIRRLCGVTFRWNENALQHFTRDIETTLSAGPNATEQENQKLWQTERDKRRNQLSTTQVGILAQDVEAVLPEAVTTDADGYKSVRYDNLIPLLIEAVKEQDQLAARQQTEIERLKVALGMSEPIVVK